MLLPGVVVVVELVRLRLPSRSLILLKIKLIILSRLFKLFRLSGLIRLRLIMLEATVLLVSAPVIKPARFNFFMLKFTLQSARILTVVTFSPEITP